MASAETPSENSACAPNLFVIHVGDKITIMYYIGTLFTGQTSYFCSSFAFEITENAITAFKHVKCL